MATAWIRPAIVGSAPGARCAHTLSACGGAQDEFVLFGGWDGKRMLNDMYTLNMATRQWVRVGTSGSGSGGSSELGATAPSARAGHSCVAPAAADSACVYVFGGGDGDRMLNDVYAFDVARRRWRALEASAASEAPPAPRSRHTCTALSDGVRLLVLFGGDDSRVFDDAYIYDTSRNAWQRVETRGARRPAARWGHTAALAADGERLFVFGGHDGVRMLDDVFVLDTRTFEWSIAAPPHANGATTTTTTAAAAGKDERPTARAGHTFTLVPGTSHMVLFGGGDGASILNDTWLFDTQSYRWTRPVIAGAPPTARCAHTVVSLNAHALVVFGGGDGTRRFKDVYVLQFTERPALASESLAVRLLAKPMPAAVAAEKKQREAATGGVSSALRAFLSERVHITDALVLDAFEREDIDLACLPLITDAQLKELGIVKMGQRLRLLKAIKEEFQASPASSSSAAPQPSEVERNAIVLAERGEFDACFECFDRALADAADDAERRASVLNNRAQALQLASRHDEALVDVDKAINMSRDDHLLSLLYTQRGVLLKRAGRADDATRAFEQAAQRGSALAKAELTAANPYAQLCSNMVQTMLKEERNR